MKYKDICKNFNVLLAGDNLTSKDILTHLDYTIDRINETLNTCYPTFSEWAVWQNPSTGLEEIHDAYDLFPDKFVRTVCTVGAAWHYYVTDEEGLQTSPQYQEDFEHALFVMQRDMLYNIPEEYMADDYQGTVQCAVDHWNLGERGIQVYGDRLI